MASEGELRCSTGRRCAMVGEGSGEGSGEDVSPGCGYATSILHVHRYARARAHLAAAGHCHSGRIIDDQVVLLDSNPGRRARHRRWIRSGPLHPSLAEGGAHDCAAGGGSLQPQRDASILWKVRSMTLEIFKGYPPDCEFPIAEINHRHDGVIDGRQKFGARTADCGSRSSGVSVALLGNIRSMSGSRLFTRQPKHSATYEVR